MKVKQQYTIHEAKSSLSRLIQRALRGEEVVIAKRDVPLVRLSAIKSAKTKLGRFKGKIKIRKDFDDPIPGFEEYQ